MGAKRPFHRTERLNSQVRQVLAAALMRGTREEILHNVMINAVQVTRDISVARVYFYVMPASPGEPQVSVEDAQAALERASGYLRSQVGQSIRARQTPELRFHFDESIDRGRRIESILADLDIPEEQEAVESATSEIDDQ